MAINLFVTGTDTGVGKTYISTGLLRALTQAGYTTLGVKPIASGAFRHNNILYNQDALDLNRASSIALDYSLTNHFVFEEPIAPHLAAKNIGISLSVDLIKSRLDKTIKIPCDIHLVEGIGGWSVPINDHETMADLVLYYKMHVILVVGMRLGCLNHALLTYQAIQQKNLPFIGWIANCFEQNDLNVDDVITSLKHWLKIPFIGKMPFGEKFEDVIDIDKFTSQSLYHRTKKPVVCHRDILGVNDPTD